MIMLSHRTEKLASKTIRHHDSPHILDSFKSSLSKQLENLNPFLLRENMDKKLKKIFSVNNNKLE